MGGSDLSDRPGVVDDTRLAILTQYVPPDQAGGVEIFNEGIKQAFGDVEVFSDPRLEAGNGGLRGAFGLEQPARALRAARSLLRSHREDPFDVILSNGIYGWPLTLARPGVPLLQVYHRTLAGFARHTLSRRIERLAQAHVMAHFDRLAGVGKHVVVVSQPVLREVESFYGLKARLILEAVDTRMFKPMDPPSARDALGLPQEVPLGLFVGRPDRTKGFDILLRVAQLMPQVLFLTAGGRHDSRLENVRSLGQIPHEDLSRWYAACDFFFLPSRYEGFGLSTLEALSCNLPVVVSEAAWPFPNGATQCGVVVRGAREREFVDAIRLVLGSRGRFSPRQFVLPQFDLAVFRETWREYIASILGAGG